MQTNLFSNTAQFYDLVASCNPAVAVDIDFYKKVIPPQARVLEIGCGTGRVAIELSRYGCLVTGVDLSPSMLAEFEKKLRTVPFMQQQITLYRADMTDFDLGTTFDWIIFPFRVFQALTETGSRNACLGAIRQHMGVKSRAILSLFNPNPDILAAWGQKGLIDLDIKLPGSAYKLRRVQNQLGHDPEAQTIAIETIYQVYDEQEIREEYHDRLELGYLYPKQARALFQANGFIIEKVFGDYDFEPLRQGVTKEQIYILRLAKRFERLPTDKCS